MRKSQDSDIIIVGAGIVGASLALALANFGKKIILIEANVPEPYQPHQDYAQRVSAINLASEAFFRHIHVWRHIYEQRTTPFLRMHVWDANGHGEIHFDSSDINQPYLGHIVENNLIQSALLGQLKNHNNVSILSPCKVSHLSVSEDHARLTLTNQQILTTKLIVGADGPHSQIRQLAQIATDVQSYGQQAIVCTVSTEHPHRHTAWQRFLPTGPLAFLPLEENQSSIVWSAANEYATTLLALDDNAFQKTLAQAIDHRLGHILNVGQRSHYPLQKHHATHYCQSRIVLIGDAAHSIHPLAGQGANLGLLDAAVLAETLYHVADPGQLKHLQRYTRRRYTYNQMMLRTMDGFHWLFGQQASPMQWLRNTGLAFTNHLPILKNTIMRHASGLSGNLPEYCRFS